MEETEEEQQPLLISRPQPDLSFSNSDFNHKGPAEAVAAAPEPLGPPSFAKSIEPLSKLRGTV